MLPVLQQNNMEIGLPDIMSKSSATFGFYAMLYQTEARSIPMTAHRRCWTLTRSQSFRRLQCLLYHHEQPKDYNFADRFRSGEMPIGIADYTMQNTLAVFAPELKGLWDFALIAAPCRRTAVWIIP
jgi:hypothetical protein